MSALLLAAVAAGLVAIAPYHPASSICATSNASAPVGTGQAAPPAYELRVIDEAGQIRWALPVRLPATVTLAYTNSIYEAATEELFALTPDGFALAAVRSTSEAVLAYNGLPAPYHREGAFFVAAASGRLREIVLRVGHTGRPRLRLGSIELPLFTAGEGARLTITAGPVP